MENDCVRFAHDFKLFPQEIPQFSIFNCQFSIMQQLYKLKFEHREETEVCAREEAQLENGVIIVCKLRFAQDGDIEIVRNA
jgi:hypothetical protein